MNFSYFLIIAESALNQPEVSEEDLARAIGRSVLRLCRGEMRDMTAEHDDDSPNRVLAHPVAIVLADEGEENDLALYVWRNGVLEFVNQLTMLELKYAVMMLDYAAKPHGRQVRLT